MAVAVLAVLVEVNEFVPIDDPGTGQLKIEAQCSAKVIVGCDETAAMQVRPLALEVACIMHQQDLGLEVSPAKIMHIEPDRLGPDIDAYETWQVNWTHEMVIGESVYDDVTVTPEKVYVGYSPEVGLPHEPAYIKSQDATNF